MVAAYDQLLCEGYLEGRHGSGTYVSRVLPEVRLTARRPPPTRPAPEGGAGPSRLSARGRALAGLWPDHPRGGAPPRAFTPGIPELGAFPFEVWGRLLGRAWRRPPEALARHGDPAGHRGLREAIARYLCAVRALRCDWTQVIVTSGAQQGLDLAARLLLDPGEAAWIEQPGYLGLRGPLLAAQAQMVPLPVDRDGISVAEGRRRAPAARLAVVTPSHQYPLGVAMSLARRLELLDWAREADAWILEDDYDSEFRYAGRPLAALQGLDADRAGDLGSGSGNRAGGRVIYLGTFSKILFPSLRLGYLVVPPELSDPLARVRAALDHHPSAAAQPALAAFFEAGHFAAHVRRRRLLYGARRIVCSRPPNVTWMDCWRSLPTRPACTWWRAWRRRSRRAWTTGRPRPAPPPPASRPRRCRPITWIRTRPQPAYPSKASCSATPPFPNPKSKPVSRPWPGRCASKTGTAVKRGQYTIYAQPTLRAPGILHRKWYTVPVLFTGK